jgi:hypothetical protein
MIADTTAKGVTLHIPILRSRYCANSTSLLWLSAFNSETVNCSQLEPLCSNGRLFLNASERVYLFVS